MSKSQVRQAGWVAWELFKPCLSYAEEIFYLRTNFYLPVLHLCISNNRISNLVITSGMQSIDYIPILVVHPLVSCKA